MDGENKPHTQKELDLAEKIFFRIFNSKKIGKIWAFVPIDLSPVTLRKFNNQKEIAEFILRPSGDMKSFIEKALHNSIENLGWEFETRSGNRNIHSDRFKRLKPTDSGQNVIDVNSDFYFSPPLKLCELIEKILFIKDFETTESSSDLNELKKLQQLAGMVMQGDWANPNGLACEYRKKISKLWDGWQTAKTSDKESVEKLSDLYFKAFEDYENILAGNYLAMAKAIMQNSKDWVSNADSLPLATPYKTNG